MPDRETPPSPAKSPVERPYIGLRPYDRKERSIFFGRDRDARFLCDKIFASRLMLFYAPSGFGKSSLLRTLVIPLLEEESARAIYFDAWTSEDPTAALKAKLIEVASQLGVPDAGAGTPTLTEIVCQLQNAADQTI